MSEKERIVMSKFYKSFNELKSALVCSYYTDNNFNPMTLSECYSIIDIIDIAIKSIEDDISNKSDDVKGYIKNTSIYLTEHTFLYENGSIGFEIYSGDDIYILKFIYNMEPDAVKFYTSYEYAIRNGFKRDSELV